MGSITTEAKVGLFILITMLLLGYMTMQVGQRGVGFKKGYVIDVAFDNAAGLNKYSAVQIAGVEVGRVEDILLKDGKALVRLRIIPDVTLEKDVTAAIKTRGVLGDKYIEIRPGTSGMAALEAGERIQNVERQADIDRLLNQIGQRIVTRARSHARAGRLVVGIIVCVASEPQLGDDGIHIARVDIVHKRCGR